MQETKDSLSSGGHQPDTQQQGWPRATSTDKQQQGWPTEPSDTAVLINDIDSVATSNQLDMQQQGWLVDAMDTSTDDWRQAFLAITNDLLFMQQHI